MMENYDGGWCAEGPGCPNEMTPEQAKRLRELAEADKDGRCVVLPCKVGDMFYTIERRRTKCRFGEEFDEYDCQGCEEECDSKKVAVVVAHQCATASQQADYIGKTVFLTREAAEAALKAGEPC